MRRNFRPGKPLSRHGADILPPHRAGDAVSLRSWARPKAACNSLIRVPNPQRSTSGPR